MFLGLTPYPWLFFFMFLKYALKKLGLRKSKTTSKLRRAFSHEDIKHPELFSGPSVLLERILIYIKARQNQSSKCKSFLHIIS